MPGGQDCVFVTVAAPLMHICMTRSRGGGGVTRSGKLRVCEARPPDPLPPSVHGFMKNIPPAVCNAVRCVSNCNFIIDPLLFKGIKNPPIDQCFRLWAAWVRLIIILRTPPDQRFPFLYTPPVHKMLKKISLSASHTRWSRHMSDPPGTR